MEPYFLCCSPLGEPIRKIGLSSLPIPEEMLLGRARLLYGKGSICPPRRNALLSLLRQEVLLRFYHAPNHTLILDPSELSPSIYQLFSSLPNQTVIQLIDPGHLPLEE